jgi:hypothetical protein
VAALALAACDNLAHIPANVCGNHVVEPGEECDGFPEKKCHGPGSPQECRFDCTKQACQPGAACAVDQVCRVASGQFSSSSIDEGELFGLLTAAYLNEDRLTDLLVRGTEKVTAITFTRERAMRIAGEVSLPLSQLTVGNLDGLAGSDMVSFRPAIGQAGDNSVRVMFADSNGVPTTVSLLAPAPEGVYDRDDDETTSSTRRLLAGDLDGDGNLEPLMLVPTSTPARAAARSQWLRG